MTDMRVIPSVERLRQRDAVRALEREFGREAIVRALREETAAVRARFAAQAAGEMTPEGSTDEAAVIAGIERGVAERLHGQTAASLRPVINATGVVVHTNLGRAPLAAPAASALVSIGSGYSNLEYDLEAGGRGRRDEHAERLLCRLTGAEAAVVANNNAAATLLILAALAKGREVLVSRGELVEIGGGFRVPEVMAQSGAILREVGTTNKTRASDYADAISSQTALILRVHRSNFRIEGFTEQPTLAELVAIGGADDIPVVEDLGSGYVGLPGETGDQTLATVLRGEPLVQDSIRVGVDIVCFSGDKLLGGPQAGIVIGRRTLVAQVRVHPLMRALRVDKLVYAALEATLAEYVAGRASRTVPVARMLVTTADTIDRRARALIEQLAGVHSLELAVIDGASAVGGGAAPGLDIPTRLVTLSAPGRSADRLERALRVGDPPVVARIENDQLVLDLRTVLPEQDDLLAAALRQLGG